jgi:hypothetical protein
MGLDSGEYFIISSVEIAVADLFPYLGSQVAICWMESIVTLSNLAKSHPKILPGVGLGSCTTYNHLDCNQWEEEGRGSLGFDFGSLFPLEIWGVKFLPNLSELKKIRNSEWEMVHTVLRSIHQLGEVRTMNFHQFEIPHKIKIGPKFSETTEISLRIPMNILHSTEDTLSKIIPSCCLPPLLQQIFVSLDRIWSLDEMKIRREKPGKFVMPEDLSTKPFRWISKEDCFDPSRISENLLDFFYGFVLQDMFSSFVIWIIEPEFITRDSVKQLRGSEQDRNSSTPV